jgi:hypothetical protein
MYFRVQGFNVLGVISVQRSAEGSKSELSFGFAQDSEALERRAVRRQAGSPALPSLEP